MPHETLVNNLKIADELTLFPVFFMVTSTQVNIFIKSSTINNKTETLGEGQEPFDQKFVRTFECVCIIFRLTCGGEMYYPKVDFQKYEGAYKL